MKKTLNLACFLFLIILHGCTGEKPGSKGILFIIGGGDRSDKMMNELVSLSGIRNSGYVYVLPMASSVPDSAIIWARDDFSKTGISNVSGFAFRKGEVPSQGQLDSLMEAKLIYISGGDQSRFMDVVLNTPIFEAIHKAFTNGAVIAGTSAGAAVMSKHMITGNQKKHPEEETGFTSIEPENIEIAEGLGMLENTIIDQHFIKRQRLNRLIAASIENPDQLCVGIDESTAIIVKGDEATVSGESQVVVIKNRRKVKDVQSGLLGTRGLELSVYLPGEKFKIKK